MLALVHCTLGFASGTTDSLPIFLSMRSSIAIYSLARASQQMLDLAHIPPNFAFVTNNSAHCVFSDDDNCNLHAVFVATATHANQIRTQPGFSDTMYLLISFRKSLPHKIVNLIFNK